MTQTLELTGGPIGAHEANPANYGSGVESYLRVRYSGPALNGEFDWYLDSLTDHLRSFVAQLEHYPLKEGDLPLLELFGGDAPGLRVAIEPKGRTGRLDFILQMNEDGLPDNMLRVRTEVSYATVQRLANELRGGIADGKVSFAIDLN